MQSLTARIASFDPPARRTKNFKPTWQISPSTHPKLTPENLAEAGFFFNPSVEEPDNCQCFSCGLQLGGWDEDDDPFVEQCKRFDCAWGEMVCAPRVARDKNEVAMTVTDEALLPSSSTSTQTRIRTFYGLSGENFWPHKPKKSWKPSIENVASAGFVYQESPDYVMCPYCQYTIGDWEAADDPLSIHQTRNPTCKFFTISLEPSTQLKASTKSAPKPRATRAKRTTAATNSAVPPSQAGSVMGDDEDMAEPSEPAKKGRKGRSTAAKPAPPAKGRGKKGMVAESEVAESVMEEDEEEAETQSVAPAEVEKPKRRGRPTKKAETEASASQPAAVLEDVQEVPEPPKKERKPRATKASKKAEAEAQAEAEAVQSQAEAVPAPEEVESAMAEEQEPTPKSKPSKSSKASRASKAPKPPIAAQIPLPAPVPAPISASHPKALPAVAASPAGPSKPSRPIKSIRAAKLEKSLAASAPAPVPPAEPASSSSRQTAPSSKSTSGKSSKPSSQSQSQSISKPLPPTPKDSFPIRSQPLNQLAQYANIPPTSPINQSPGPSRELLDADLEKAAKSARQVVTDLAQGGGEENTAKRAEQAEDEESWMKAPLTAEEKKMTVQQLIERELQKRGKVMEEEGEEMIRKWKEEATAVRAQIQAALCP